MNRVNNIHLGLDHDFEATVRIWLDQQRELIPSKTSLGHARGYLHRQWPRLILFLKDGKLELTNNNVERELSNFVLGRRNWLFTWKVLGGDRTAHVLTIVGTCVAQGVNPRACLHLVAKLLINGWPQSKLRDLSPDRLVTAYPDIVARQQPRPDLPAVPRHVILGGSAIQARVGFKTSFVDGVPV